MAIDPLRGLRVLDLTNVLAGPYCCYQLALLGAEVLKIERPDGGDLARELGADPTRNAKGMGISFLAQNANKKSVTLDLKQEADKKRFRALVRKADILVENFRPGVMDRLGLGHANLCSDNPNLIYCAISGFGQTGPRRNDPAYDQIVQGVSGVMSITGAPDTAPYRVGYPLADTIGGMTAAFAICAALNETPRGGFLDISMTEAVVSTMGWSVSNYLIGGVTPAPHGNENTTSAPSGTFATADDPINIAANRDTQWEALALHLGRGDLLDNPDYHTREDRKKNRHALRKELESALRTKPSTDWIPELNALGVPSGPVLRLEQTLEDVQITERGLISTTHVDHEALPLVASPVVIDGKRPAPHTSPPALGESNDHIWSDWGIDTADPADSQSEEII